MVLKSITITTNAGDTTIIDWLNQDGQEQIHDHVLLIQIILLLILTTQLALVELKHLLVIP